MERGLSRWSLWRTRKRKVKDHIQFVHSQEEIEQQNFEQACDSRVDKERDSASSSTTTSTKNTSNTYMYSNEPDWLCQLPGTSFICESDDQSSASNRSKFTDAETHENCSPSPTLAETRGDRIDFGYAPDVSVSNLSDETDEDIFSDEYYSPSASDEDTDTLSFNEKSDMDRQLMDDLSNWAADSQIPHSKLKGLLSVLHHYHPHLPKDPRTLLQTTTSYKILDFGDGEYYHFGLASSINKLVQFQGVDRDIDGIQIQVNIDGLPLYKSSKAQFWPILGRVVSPSESEVFVVGLYSGMGKPSNVDKYLAQFVSEMKELERTGVHIDKLNKTVPISVACFICDAPARAFVKGTKPHNAYYGCEKCIQKGVWAGKVIFPEVNSQLRTDLDVKEMMHEEHHNYPTPLSQLSVGLVSQFPLDPMHLVHLGVVKRMIWSWIKGPIGNGCRISVNTARQISASLISCHPYAPREFVRKCRSLDEFERWKATEFRQFIIYSGVVVLKGKLSVPFYHHFLLLAVSIFCLSSSVFLSTHCDYADDLLKLFVHNWAGLYGRDMLVYNVHGLAHLAQDAKLYGPLDSYSAFPFESFLGRLKKIVRKPHRCLPQVIRRLSEMKTGGQKRSNEDISLGTKHADGPILILYKGFHQHRSMQIDGFYISTSDGNNCVQIGSSYGLIRNIIQDPENLKVFLMFEQLMLIEDFFQHPLKSSDLGIVKASRLSGTLKAEKVSDIVCKHYRMPYHESFVLVPVVHQLC